MTGTTIGRGARSTDSPSNSFKVNGILKSSRYVTSPKDLGDSPTDSPTAVDGIHAFFQQGHQPNSSNTSIDMSMNSNSNHDDEHHHLSPAEYEECSAGNIDSAKKMVRGAVALLEIEENRERRRLAALGMTEGPTAGNAAMMILRECLEPELLDKKAAADAKRSVLEAFRLLQEGEDQDYTRQCPRVGTYSGLSSRLGIASLPVMEEKKRNPRESLKELLAEKLKTSSSNDTEDDSCLSKKYRRMSQSLSGRLVDDGDDDVADHSMCASDGRGSTRRWQTRAETAKLTGTRGNEEESHNKDEPSEDKATDDARTTEPDYESEEDGAQGAAPSPEPKTPEPPKTTHTSTPGAKPKSILKRRPSTNTLLVAQSAHVTVTPARSILHSLYDEGKNRSLTRSDITMGSCTSHRPRKTTLTSAPTTPNRSHRRTTSSRKAQDGNSNNKSVPQEQREEESPSNASTTPTASRRLASTSRAQSARRLQKRQPRSSSRRQLEKTNSDISKISQDSEQRIPSRTTSSSSAASAMPKRLMESGRQKRSSEAKSPRSEGKEGRREPAIARKDSAEGQRRERVASKDSLEGHRREREASRKDSEGGEGRPRSRSRTRRNESSRIVRKGASRSRSRARRTTSHSSDLIKMSQSVSAIRTSDHREDEQDTTTGRTNIRSRRNLATSKSDRKLTKARFDRNGTRKVRGGESKKAPPTAEEELDKALAAYMSRSHLGSETDSLYETQGDVADVTVLQFDPTVRHNVATISPNAPPSTNPAAFSSAPDSCTHQDLEDGEDKASKKKHRRRSSINVKLPLWGKK